MRKGYFKGNLTLFGIRDANDELKEFFVYYTKMKLYDPVLEVEITDEDTRLAYFVKNYLNDTYYELDEDFITKCEKKFKKKKLTFIDVEEKETE